MQNNSALGTSINQSLMLPELKYHQVFVDLNNLYQPFYNEIVSVLSKEELDFTNLDIIADKMRGGKLIKALVNNVAVLVLQPIIINNLKNNDLSIDTEKASHACREALVDFYSSLRSHRLIDHAGIYSLMAKLELVAITHFANQYPVIDSYVFNLTNYNIIDDTLILGGYIRDG